jgi:hypothetical protein
MPKPNNPFEHEKCEANPQQYVDDILKRPIGRVDCHQHDHRNAAKDRNVGGLGHVMTARRGHKSLEAGSVG